MFVWNNPAANCGEIYFPTKNNKQILKTLNKNMPINPGINIINIFFRFNFL